MSCVTTQVDSFPRMPIKASDVQVLPKSVSLPGLPHPRSEAWAYAILAAHRSQSLVLTLQITSLLLSVFVGPCLTIQPTPHRILKEGRVGIEPTYSMSMLLPRSADYDAFRTLRY